jgi:hypothetical protein
VTRAELNGYPLSNPMRKIVTGAFDEKAPLAQARLLGR